MLSLILMAGAVVAQTGTEICRSGLTHMILVDARVQRELKLTEPQKVAVWDIRWSTSEKLGDLVRAMMKADKFPDYRKDVADVERINAEMVAALAGALDPGQLARFGQIRLQYLRDEALLDPEVQKSLKMDPGQVEKVLSTFVAYREGVARRTIESNKLPRPEQMRLVSQRMLEDIKAREEALKQMGAVLTHEQKAALETLKGPIFRPEGRNPIGSFKETVPIPRAVQDR